MKVPFYQSKVTKYQRFREVQLKLNTKTEIQTHVSSKRTVSLSLCFSASLSHSFPLPHFPDHRYSRTYSTTNMDMSHVTYICVGGIATRTQMGPAHSASHSHCPTQTVAVIHLSSLMKS